MLRDNDRLHVVLWGDADELRWGKKIYKFRRKIISKWIYWEKYYISTAKFHFMHWNKSQGLTQYSLWNSSSFLLRASFVVNQSSSLRRTTRGGCAFLRECLKFSFLFHMTRWREANRPRGLPLWVGTQDCVRRQDAAEAALTTNGCLDLRSRSYSAAIGTRI